MADLGTTLKGIWMKGMEAIGNTASNIATNTRSKVDEMNLVNRRNEILKDFGNKAYALWQKGEQFPEELASQLQELAKLDEMLNDLRAERIAMVKQEQEAAREAGAAEETEPAAEAEIAEEAEETPAEAEESAKTEEAEAAEAPAEPETAEETEAQEEEVPVIRVENTSVSEAIDQLFDKVPSAEEAVGKVNEALDSLGEGLKSFSDTLDRKIGDLSDTISGDKPE